jgi:RNA polymerase sigma factor (TIGR02999 family)
MSVTDEQDILTTLREGEQEALDQLVPLLYEELRRAAHRQLSFRRNPNDSTPTFGTTALVNEAYLKLVDQERATWKDRAHFLAIAAVAMRHVLVDRARARAATKRGGEHRKVTLEDVAFSLDEQPEVILAIDQAIKSLEALDPRLAKVVVARFFGGLSEEEVAQALGITKRTVQRDWIKARMLLRRALE